MNTSDPFGLLTPFTAEDDLAAAAWDAKEAARKARALARKPDARTIDEVEAEIIA